MIANQRVTVVILGRILALLSSPGLFFNAPYPLGTFRMGLTPTITWPESVVHTVKYALMPNVYGSSDVTLI